MNEFLQTLSDERYAFLTAFARILLGFLFFFQGYDAVFRVGIRQVADTYQDSFASHHFPQTATLLGACFTSLAELVGGLLLILGLLKYLALYLLGIDLLVACLGFGIMQPMWDMRHFFPRLFLLLFLLYVPSSWDTGSLDHILFRS